MAIAADWLADSRKKANLPVLNPVKQEMRNRGETDITVNALQKAFRGSSSVARPTRCEGMSISTSKGRWT